MQARVPEGAYIPPAHDIIEGNNMFHKETSVEWLEREWDSARDLWQQEKAPIHSLLSMNLRSSPAHKRSGRVMSTTYLPCRGGGKWKILW